MGVMDIFSLFIGFHPHEVFGEQLSVDFSELLIVFGAIAANLVILVWFGNWWSR